MTGKCTKIVQDGNFFWLFLKENSTVEKKQIFCPTFNLFWCCSSRCVMCDETHICSVHDRPLERSGLVWQVCCCVVARPKSYLKSCRNLWQIHCCVAGDLNQLFENPSGICNRFTVVWLWDQNCISNPAGVCGKFAVVWPVTLTNFLKIPWRIIVILLSVLVTSHKLPTPFL